MLKYIVYRTRESNISQKPFEFRLIPSVYIPFGNKIFQVVLIIDAGTLFGWSQRS